MTQTRDGFLWFGTMYGLVRYDGYEYRTYYYDPSDSTSLSNDDIVTLFEDSEGDLWVGTYGGGVNRFDRSSGMFERYRFNDSGHRDVVWAISEDRQGRILVGTQHDGLLALEESGRNERRKSVRPYAFPGALAGPIIALDVDDKGDVWAVVNGRWKRPQTLSGTSI